MATIGAARLAPASARAKARIAGLFYALNIVTAVFAMFGGGRLIVSGNPAATATKLLGHELLFRLSFASNLIATACYIVVTLLLYKILKPVNRSVSLLAAFFSLVGLAVGSVSSVFHLTVLSILTETPYLRVFTVEQVQALALLFRRIEMETLDVSIIFFGFYCLLIGWLISRSTFLPRTVGLLVALSGLGWLTYLSPPLASYLSPYLPITGLLGEGSLTLWLLVVGLNGQRWHDLASTEDPLRG